MSVTAQRDLRTAIDQRRFDSVYYLHGDDEYRKDEAIAQLIGSAVDPATKDFNLDRFRGADTDAERLAAALAALPVFAERRAVVVRDIEDLSKAARTALDRYLASPARDIVLVLTSAAGEKPIAAISERSTGVAFPPLSEEKLAAWLVKYARESGMTLGDAEARTIVSAVNGDLAYAAGEVNKLVAYTSGRAATAADITAIVGVHANESVETLLDAVAERDATRARALVGPVLALPKVNAVTLISNFAAQFVGMAAARAMLDTGTRADRLVRELEALNAATRPFLGRPWGNAPRAWARNVPAWSATELARALTVLCDADSSFKDTRASSDEAFVEALVLSLAAPRRGTVAA